MVSGLTRDRHDPCTHNISPGRASDNTAFASSTRGTRSVRRLLGASRSKIARSTSPRFCWCCIPRPIVTSTSNSCCASLMSSPFFTPLHPRRATVVTSNSGAKKRVSLAGTFSSSSKRIHRCRRHLQVSYRLLARHAREIFEKLVQRIPGREMLYEYLHRNPRALEHQRPTHDLRISRDHICLLHRSGPPSFGRFPAVS